MEEDGVWKNEEIKGRWRSKKRVKKLRKEKKKKSKESMIKDKDVCIKEKKENGEAKKNQKKY